MNKLLYLISTASILVSCAFLDPEKTKELNRVPSSNSGFECFDEYDNNLSAKFKLIVGSDGFQAPDVFLERLIIKDQQNHRRRIVINNVTFSWQRSDKCSGGSSLQSCFLPDGDYSDEVLKIRLGNLLGKFRYSEFDWYIEYRWNKNSRFTESSLFKCYNSNPI